MKITDAEKYNEWKNKNTDPYSAGCFRYAERWANMMELAMQQGECIKDIAKDTSHYADTEGITGFMYGMAVNILAQYWEHGEELRKWHNGEYDHNGDGVVNPAIMVLN